VETAKSHQRPGYGPYAHAANPGTIQQSRLHLRGAAGKAPRKGTDDKVPVLGDRGRMVGAWPSLLVVLATHVMASRITSAAAAAALLAVAAEAIAHEPT
jgi:hypothetical protein